MGIGYRRQLKTLDASMVVVGAIIGSGIYLGPPLVAQNTGSIPLALGLWVLGGIITIAGGFCFAELGARLPEAGGSYVYLREGFGRMAAFLQGWALLLVSGAGSVAAVASFCAGNIVSLADLAPSAKPFVALAAIWLFTAVNCVGVRPGATTQNILTFLKIATLGLIAWVGLTGGPAAPPPTSPALHPTGAPTAAHLGAALITIIFAYNGWQVVSFLAGEIDDASRRLPRAIIGGIVGTMIVYLLVNFAYVRGLGIDGLAANKYPASVLMEHAMGKLGGTIMTWGVIISTLGFLNVAILTVPRAFQAMSQDRLFFDRVGQIHERYHTPVNAILLQSIWASLLVFFNELQDLIAAVGFSDALFLGLCAAALIVIRRRETPTEAAQVVFRAPGHPVLPLFYLLASAILMASSIAAKPDRALIGAGLILLGIPMYLYWEMFAARDAAR